MFELVLKGIPLGHTLYHNNMIAGLGLHPHLTSESPGVTVDELTIFFHGVHKVLGLVKCRMACIDIDHELLMGRSDRDVKSFPHCEPSPDIFRLWVAEKKALVRMLFCIVIPAYFDTCPRGVCSED